MTIKYHHANTSTTRLSYQPFVPVHVYSYAKCYIGTYKNMSVSNVTSGTIPGELEMGLLYSTKQNLKRNDTSKSVRFSVCPFCKCYRKP